MTARTTRKAETDRTDRTARTARTAISDRIARTDKIARTSRTPRMFHDVVGCCRMSRSQWTVGTLSKVGQVKCEG